MRRVGGVVGARGAQRALRHAGVVARGGGSGGGGGGGGGNGGPPHLTQEQQRRAVGILSAARQLDLRRLGSQMGGTLLVDDATHKAEVQQAARDGTLSFGFSAGGCLFPYFIGSAGAMMDAGVLTDSVQLGGASAGSLLAATIKSGMPLDSIVEQNLRLMADLRAGGTRGRLGPVLKAFLEEHLPEDAHFKCNGTCHVAVTRVAPVASGLLVSDFADRADLVQALMTSCHIPFWLDGNAFTEFRGERSCDGGLTNFIPIPPGTVGVRVSCFPSKQLSPVYRIGISPDTFEPWGYSLRQMVQWAFEPADEAMVAALIDKGKRDAHCWMESMDLVGQQREAERKEERAAGQVAAAKAAAVGTVDARTQQSAQREGEQRLADRAQRGKAPGAVTPAAAAAGPAAGSREQQAAASPAALQAVEAAAAQEDAGASKQEQELAAERALRQAEEKEGEEGNLWARALGAAGVAASAAAVASAVTKGLLL